MAKPLKFRNGHPIKEALICYVLLKNGPAQRIPIMKAVHALENSKLAFQPTSNIAYWLRDKYSNPWCRDSDRSVLLQMKERGPLVEKVGVQNRFHIYDLTAEGRQLALQVQEYYAH